MSNYETMPNLTTLDKGIISTILVQVLEKTNNVLAQMNLPDEHVFLKQVKILSEHLANDKELIFEETDVMVILETLRAFHFLAKIKIAKMLLEKKEDWENEVLKKSLRQAKLAIIYSKFFEKDSTIEDFMF